MPFHVRLLLEVLHRWLRWVSASFAIFLILNINGCASPLKATTSADREAFLAGNIQFDCQSCGFTVGHYLHEMEKQNKAGAWDRLYELVIGIGYGNDLTYYYLGKSAEGLGKVDAAKIYYQRGLSSDQKCNPPLTIANACLGHSFPGELRARLAQLDAKPASFTQTAQSVSSKKVDQENAAFAAEFMKCHTDTDCNSGFRCRAKSGGGTECKINQTGIPTQGVNESESENSLSALSKVASGILRLGTAFLSGYSQGRASSMSTLAPAIPVENQRIPASRANGGGTTYPYQSSNGTRYQYDLSNPMDRVGYSTDLGAQMRDKLDWSPTKGLDQGVGQYGGGVKP